MTGGVSDHVPASYAAWFADVLRERGAAVVDRDRARALAVTLEKALEVAESRINAATDVLASMPCEYAAERDDPGNPDYAYMTCVDVEAPDWCARCCAFGYLVGSIEDAPGARPLRRVVTVDTGGRT